VQAASRRGSSLPPDLEAQSRRIERIARGFGLDFAPVVFELLDASDVNGIAAYGGFPVRYPSWRFGMEFERLDKGYTWGLSKIYELVINNDPVVAYLVRSNSALEQKLVMAHVFGHADFFKHNAWFASTDRHMLDTMAMHATRLRRDIDRHGLDTVERFLDLALVSTCAAACARRRPRRRPTTCSASWSRTRRSTSGSARSSRSSAPRRTTSSRSA
jgi:stage V sporulation protein R